MLEFGRIKGTAEKTEEWSQLGIEPDRHDDDLSSTWHIYGMRWETDEELKKREKELEKVKQMKKKIKADREARDLKEFERLKKKFGQG